MITSHSRRSFLKQATAISSYPILSASGLLHAPFACAEWNLANFASSPMDVVLKNLLQGKPVVTSNKIQVKLPPSADNKTPVPITITTDLKGIKSIAILVEQNPVPLVAIFELSPTLAPYVSTRLKLLHSSFVFVLLETDKVFYGIKQTVTISDTGCEA